MMLTNSMGSVLPNRTEAQQSWCNIMKETYLEWLPVLVHFMELPGEALRSWKSFSWLIL